MTKEERRGGAIELWKAVKLQSDNEMKIRLEMEKRLNKEINASYKGSALDKLLKQRICEF